MRYVNKVLWKVKTCSLLLYRGQRKEGNDNGWAAP